MRPEYRQTQGERKRNGDEEATRGGARRHSPYRRRRRGHGRGTGAGDNRRRSQTGRAGAYLQGLDPGPAEQGEQNETSEGKETPENEAAEDQQEKAEAQQLQSLAKIDQAAAEQAALRAIPGTAKDAELGNENGYVVWEVEVAGDDGKLHEVKVDAGNGQVLQQEADDEDSEQDEANEGPEGGETNEPAEATGA